MLVLGCGDLGFASGIFAAAVGHLPAYEATATGAGAFIVTLGVSLAIASFAFKGDGGAD
ncbi:hypothetical protein [Streptomyces sp. NPDC055186]